MLEYNVPHGKRNRGLTVINAFRHLAKPDQLTDDNVLKAMVLGWCVEWVSMHTHPQINPLTNTQIFPTYMPQLHTHTHPH